MHCALPCWVVDVDGVLWKIGHSHLAKHSIASFRLLERAPYIPRSIILDGSAVHARRSCVLIATVVDSFQLEMFGWFARERRMTRPHTLRHPSSSFSMSCTFRRCILARFEDGLHFTRFVLCRANDGWSWLSFWGPVWKRDAKSLHDRTVVPSVEVSVPPLRRRCARSSARTHAPSISSPLLHSHVSRPSSCAISLFSHRFVRVSPPSSVVAWSPLPGHFDPLFPWGCGSSPSLSLCVSLSRGWCLLGSLGVR